MPAIPYTQPSNIAGQYARLGEIAGGTASNIFKTGAIAAEDFIKLRRSKKATEALYQEFNNQLDTKVGVNPNLSPEENQDRLMGMRDIAVWHKANKDRAVLPKLNQLLEMVNSENQAKDVIAKFGGQMKRIEDQMAAKQKEAVQRQAYTEAQEGLGLDEGAAGVYGTMSPESLGATDVKPQDIAGAADERRKRALKERADEFKADIARLRLKDNKAAQFLQAASLAVPRRKDIEDDLANARMALTSLPPGEDYKNVSQQVRQLERAAKDMDKIIDNALNYVGEVGSRVAPEDKSLSDPPKPDDPGIFDWLQKSVNKILNRMGGAGTAQPQSIPNIPDTLNLGDIE